jgi:hypothetical protein
MRGERIRHSPRSRLPRRQGLGVTPPRRLRWLDDGEIYRPRVELHADAADFTSELSST